MKAQVIEKYNFTKPLGMVLILITISLICLAQCLPGQNANVESTGEKFDFLRIEEESEIQIEEWMIDESYWNKRNTFDFLIEETEPEIQIEKWMVDFSINENIYAENEPEIKVEPWMYETAFWTTSKETRLANKENQEEEVIIEHWIYNKPEITYQYLFDLAVFGVERGAWSTRQSNHLLPSSRLANPSLQMAGFSQIRRVSFVINPKSSALNYHLKTVK
jgi:hypothetical protein